MNLSEETWSNLKKEIETSISKDSNITDVIVNYQLKESKGTKNILTYSVILNK
tara:strand:- start:571 stop:729 length:159 start_codon:yes stop_codon:yes gene_type:complete